VGNGVESAEDVARAIDEVGSFVRMRHGRRLRRGEGGVKARGSGRPAKPLSALKVDLAALFYF
jgi:hypothetical protein